MTIIEALKSDTNYLRLDASGKWLWWNTLTREWVVSSTPYRARKNKEHYRGDSEESAVQELLK